MFGRKNLPHNRGTKTADVFVKVETKKSWSVPKFVVFEGKDGLYYWHLKAGNGKIIAQSEGYTDRRNANESAMLVRRVASLSGIKNA